MPESKPKHTPGPWVANNTHVTTKDAWRLSIAYAPYRVIDANAVPSLAEAEGNAALIARAPELLAENERLRAQLAELREAAREADSVLTDLELVSSSDQPLVNGALSHLRTALARTPAE